MKAFIALACACVIVAVLTWIAIDLLEQPKCLRSHQVTVHVPARTILMPMGKALMPIYQPAHDVVETVCDEFEQKKD